VLWVPQLNNWTCSLKCLVTSVSFKSTIKLLMFLISLFYLFHVYISSFNLNHSNVSHQQQDSTATRSSSFISSHLHRFTRRNRSFELSSSIRRIEAATLSTFSIISSQIQLSIVDAFNAFEYSISWLCSNESSISESYCWSDTRWFNLS
jgi:hypothetical protein